ncbi:MAG: hypothetical protein D6680_19140 [Cyanobacteria bacterium J007]|nr:MAG: hypothetical protein D6680_19140 [Cyanobacteria bacterium J007]
MWIQRCFYAIAAIALWSGFGSSPALSQPETLSERGVEPLSASLSGTRSRQVERPWSPLPTPESSPVAQHVAQDVAQNIAQNREIEPGRRTRSGPSYLGIGVNIGFNEDGGSPLGNGNFAVISKIGLLEQVSARPAILFGDDLMFLLPVTVDFPLQDTEEVARATIAPYLGGGLALSPNSDNFLGGFGTVGLDTALTSNFTATVGVNLGYVKELELGVIVGGGYTF